MASWRFSWTKSFCQKFYAGYFPTIKTWYWQPLTGFLLGSLYKVWPWKEVTQYYTNSSGERVPLNSVSVFPDAFNADAQLVPAITAFFLGLILLFLLERLSKNKSDA